MSLEEIMARAEAAAQNKTEVIKKESVEKEISSYEETQEQKAAMQARLEEIARQKNIDKTKLEEIRQFLTTPSQYAKGKKDLRKVMNEAGMSEEEIQPFIDEAKNEQRSIVNGKLDKRSQKKDLKSNVESLSSEEKQLNDEIESIGEVKLSESAQEILIDKEFQEKYTEKLERNSIQSVDRLVDLGGNDNQFGGEIEVPGTFLDRQQLEDGYVEALSKQIEKEINLLENDPDYPLRYGGYKKDENGEFSDDTKQMMNKNRANLRKAKHKSINITVKTSDGKKVVWSSK